MKENNEIDKIFVQFIEPHEMTPDDKVWNTLEDKLNRKTDDKYKPIAIWLSVALITVVTLFTGFIIYHFNSSNNTLRSEKMRSPSHRSNAFTINNRPSKTIDLNTSADLVLENGSGDITKKNLFSNAKKENPTPKSENEKSSSPINGNSLKSDFIASVEIHKTKSNSTDAPSGNSVLVKNNDSDLIPKKEDEVKNIDSVNLTNDNLVASSTIQENKIIVSGDTELSDVQKKTDSVSNKIIPPIETKQENKKLLNKLSVLAYFSPDLNYKYFRNEPVSFSRNNSNNGNNNGSNGNNANNNGNNDGENNDDEKEDYNSTEEAKFSFNSGVLVGLDLNKHWTVKTGASYNYISQVIQPKIAIAKTNKNGDTDYQLNTSYGAVVVPSDASVKPSSGDSLLINAKSNQIIQIINVPLILNCQTERNKFSFFTEFGLTANFILSQKLNTNYLGKERTFSEVKGLKKFYPGAILGIGASYRIGKKVKLFIEPTFRGALTPINKFNTKRAYPYSFGIFGGLVYHF